MAILLLIILVIVIGSKVVYKDNFAILNGTINVSKGTGTVDINYPAGFTNTNCTVIAVGISHGVSTSDVLFFGTSGDRTTGAVLYSNKIRVSTSSNDNVGPTGDLKYKIVLMKI